ncbi:molybdopterin-binding protein [Pseudoroseomonas cervicalis]|uniref:molybdopterin-binding protein n=1 Tax=Teichococcus cervicalis TaxID=204525 RepID=UPI00277F4109|nr:molybdopterin-binding protein [Pseudoroseomonas cervicalis]MDQ1081764.1 molybdopterin molybdotransferase [Pseudoroseomonas cervicalis]
MTRIAAPPLLTDPDLALARLLALLPALAPRRLAAGEAVGLVLAEALRLPGPVPPAPRALRDGWALEAAETLGAGPYAPAPLSRALAVASGEALPPGCDAVLDPFDITHLGPLRAALRDAIPGEGVRGAGEEAPEGFLLAGAGTRLRPLALPLLAAAGIGRVAVRQPRLALLPVGEEWMGGMADSLSPCLAALALVEGAACRLLPAVPDAPDAIAAALRGAAAEADLLCTLGGSGQGPSDHSAAGLDAAGALLLHGIGARPGASAGFGQAGATPVLLLPGRAEDALAAWLLLARPALRRLAQAAPPPRRRLRLARKLASSVGLAEIALLRREGEAAIPLGLGSLTLAALAQADHALILPAATEGHEEGAWIEAEPLWSPA